MSYFPFFSSEFSFEEFLEVGEHHTCHADCYFAKFNKDRDGAIKVKAGGLLTAVRNTFVNNTVFTKSKPEDKVGGGPHIGIYAGSNSDLSSLALLLHDV